MISPKPYIVPLILGVLLFAGSIAHAGTLSPDKRFTVYNGVVSIDGNGDVLELGNAGRDIASTGFIYIRPGIANGGYDDGGASPTSFGTYFEGISDGVQTLHLTGQLCLNDGGGEVCRNTWPSGGGSGGTLDDAYDFGGPGAGKKITVDIGAVELIGNTTIMPLTLSSGRNDQINFYKTDGNIAPHTLLDRSDVGFRFYDIVGGTAFDGSLFEVTEIIDSGGVAVGGTVNIGINDTVIKGAHDTTVNIFSDTVGSYLQFQAAGNYQKVASVGVGRNLLLRSDGYISLYDSTGTVARVTGGKIGVQQTLPGATLTVNNPTTSGKVGIAQDTIYSYADAATGAAISAEQAGAGYAGYFSGRVTISRGASGTALSVLSGNVANHTNIEIGRTSGEVRIAVVPSGGLYFTNISAGDTAIRVDNAANRLHLGAGSANSTLVIGSGDVWIGTAASPRNICLNDNCIASWPAGGGDDGDWTISGANIYSTLAGTVGIGQNTSGAKLAVNQFTTAGKTGSVGDAVYAYAISNNAAISAEQVGAGYAGYFSGKVLLERGGPQLGPDPSNQAAQLSVSTARTYYAIEAEDVELTPNICTIANGYGVNAAQIVSDPAASNGLAWRAGCTNGTNTFLGGLNTKASYLPGNYKLVIRLKCETGCSPIGGIIGRLRIYSYDGASSTRIYPISLGERFIRNEDLLEYNRYENIEAQFQVTDPGLEYWFWWQFAGGGGAQTWIDTIQILPDSDETNEIIYRWGFGNGSGTSNEWTSIPEEIYNHRPEILTRGVICLSNTRIAGTTNFGPRDGALFSDCVKVESIRGCRQGDSFCDIGSAEYLRNCKYPMGLRMVMDPTITYWENRDQGFEAMTTTRNCGANNICGDGDDAGCSTTAITGNASLYY